MPRQAAHGLRQSASANFAIVLSLALTLASPAGAAESSATDFLACANERDDARRLACFDTAAARAGIPGEPGGAAPASAPTMPLSKEEKFGLRGDLKQEKAKAAPELAETQEIEAQVTKVAVKPHGELVMTLDNGQVWYEIQTSTGIRVKVGDKVTIKAGALGSYIVVAPNGRSSKVTRSH